MAGIDIISDSTGKEIVAAIQSTDVAQARILEINTAAEAKKNEVLESIPEDYRNIANEVDSLKGDISNKITKFYASNQGQTHLADSDNGKIQDMMIYGKSSQDGTPSPENPVEIKSVVNPTVKVLNEDETQFKAATLPYTLNAIPVSSGGNITIDGQQYIADYVDVERGKLVRMIQKRALNGTETWRMTNLEEYNYFALTTSDDAQLQSILPNNKNIRCNLFKAGELNENNILRLGGYERIQIRYDSANTVEEFKNMLSAKNAVCYFILQTPFEINLAPEEVQVLKALVTYYPTTNISINSEQLDGYTVFNYPISMANGWNYVKKQLNDNRDYIYDMDMQSAEAYVNSEYAVALTELEV